MEKLNASGDGYPLRMKTDPISGIPHFLIHFQTFLYLTAEWTLLLIIGETCSVDLWPFMCSRTRVPMPLQIIAIPSL